MSGSHAPKPRWRMYAFAGALILFAIGTQVMFYKGGGPLEMQPVARKLKISATVLPDPKPVPQFTLTDHHGNTFTRDNLKGRWTLMAFGYTSCPDVCPALLATFRRIEGLLAGAAFEYPPDYVFVTVDPLRDSVEELAAFVPRFSEKIIGLTGDAAQIEVLTRELGIMNLRQEGGDRLEPVVPPKQAAGPGHSGHGDEEAYLIDHTDAILIISPDATVHALTSSPHNADVIARDYRNIVSLAAAVAASTSR